MRTKIIFGITAMFLLASVDAAAQGTLAEATKGNFLFRRYPDVLPGSEIVVPRRPQRERMSPQAWIGIGSALASIGLTIATIATLNK